MPISIIRVIRSFKKKKSGWNSTFQPLFVYLSSVSDRTTCYITS